MFILDFTSSFWTSLMNKKMRDVYCFFYEEKIYGRMGLV